MKSRNLSTLLALTILAVSPAHAAFLLSDNTVSTNAAAVFQTTERINTGATYTWLTDSDTNNKGIGNTDADLLKNDPSQSKLTDGLSELVGGTGAVHGTWDGQFGGTVLFDLQDVYEIESVFASVRWVSPNTGIGSYQVFVSTNGTSYSSLGTWDDSKNVLDTDGRNTIISITASSPVEARYIKIFFSNWDGTHASRLFHQQVIGEVAIYGNTAFVPEPATYAMIAGVAILFLAILRRRS